MVITEALVGYQLVKASISGIKSVIQTCDDVSQIAHHIDNVFSGEEHVNKKIAAKKKAAQKGKWHSFISHRLRSEDDGDGTSIQEIAQEIIEKKQIEKERTNLAHKKVMEEGGKLLIILGLIVAMYYYISYACKGCI